VLKIPDLVDISIQDVNSKISNLQDQLNGINQDVSTLKARPVAVAASAAPGGSPGGPPGPPPGPGGPAKAPPPPGGPARAPPPPGGPKPGPAPRPAQPVSLRGAIMGELKSLFNKRRAQSG